MYFNKIAHVFTKGVHEIHANLFKYVYVYCFILFFLWFNENKTMTRSWMQETALCMCQEMG